MSDKRAEVWVVEALREDGKPRKNRFPLATKQQAEKDARFDTGSGFPSRAVRFVEDDGPCLWRWDDDGLWRTDCGLAWDIPNNGGPAENGMNYCPKCGRRIEEARDELGT